MLRTSLALQQPGAKDWTNTYAYDSARRLDYIAGSSGTFDDSYASVAGVIASRFNWVVQDAPRTSGTRLALHDNI